MRKGKKARSLAVALLVTAGLAAGCDAEPSTSTEAGEEQTLPGEPGAPPTVATPDPNATDPNSAEPTEG